MLKLSLVSFAVLLTFLATDCNGVSLNQDLTLTKSQKEALDKVILAHSELHVARLHFIFKFDKIITL